MADAVAFMTGAALPPELESGSTSDELIQSIGPEIFAKVVKLISNE